MKKLLLIFCILGMGEISFAQWTTSGSNIYNSNTDNVGIGTNSPSYKLHVITTSTLGVALQTNSSTVRGPQLDFYDAGRRLETVISSTDGTTIGTYIASYSNHPLLFGTNAGSSPSSKMIILGNGNVGIGTTDPQGYKLAVNGNMIAEAVKVKLHANWPDYVFHKNYSLKPLAEVEQYIKINEHLPDIPSANEVKEDGLNLGEMNAKLLQKIEELTLYLIEKDKQLIDLQERVRTLEGKK